MYERPTVSLPKSEKKPKFFVSRNLLTSRLFPNCIHKQSDLWSELYIYVISLTCRQFIAREYYFDDYALFSGIIALLWSTIIWLSIKVGNMKG